MALATCVRRASRLRIVVSAATSHARRRASAPPQPRACLLPLLLPALLPTPRHSRASVRRRSVCAGPEAGPSSPPTRWRRLMPARRGVGPIDVWRCGGGAVACSLRPSSILLVVACPPMGKRAFPPLTSLLGPRPRYVLMFYSNTPKRPSGRDCLIAFHAPALPASLLIYAGFREWC